MKVGGRYEPKDGKIAAVETFISKTGETPELRKQTQEENMGWYKGISPTSLRDGGRADHIIRSSPRSGTPAASPIPACAG